MNTAKLGVAIAHKEMLDEEIMDDVVERLSPRSRAAQFDRAIGASVRKHRRAIGLIQNELGPLIGVTFQQLQKYESGNNRISAGRLLLAAEALRIPVEDFFGVPTDGLSDESDHQLFRSRNWKTASQLEALPERCKEPFRDLIATLAQKCAN